MSSAPGTPTIVVVESDEATRLSWGRVLAPLGFRLLLTAGAEEALAVLEHQRATCLLADLEAPAMNGLAVVAEALDLDPNLAIIVVTGRPDAVTAKASMFAGTIDWLTRPVGLRDLVQTVERATRQREERLAREEAQRWLRREFASHRVGGGRVERQEGHALASGALEALVMALEAKDRFMSGHSVRVAQLAASLAAELGHSDEEVELARRAGRLHDLGMIAVPEELLTKAEPLVEAEFAEIRKHPKIGAELLRPYAEFSEVARFVRGHHERWDGTGYPDGTAGAAIPWGARILAAAEIYDALVSDRIYRPNRMSPESACVRMGELAGNAVDPEVHRALMTVVARRQALEFLPDEQPGGHHIALPLPPAWEILRQ